MTPQQIKANAPDGATHYEIVDDTVLYYINDDGFWLGSDDEGSWWNLFSGDFDYYNENAKPL